MNRNERTRLGELRFSFIIGHGDHPDAAAHRSRFDASTPDRQQIPNPVTYARLVERSGDLDSTIKAAAFAKGYQSRRVLHQRNARYALAWQIHNRLKAVAGKCNCHIGSPHAKPKNLRESFEYSPQIRFRPALRRSRCSIHDKYFMDLHFHNFDAFESQMRQFRLKSLANRPIEAKRTNRLLFASHS